MFFTSDVKIWWKKNIRIKTYSCKALIMKTIHKKNNVEFGRIKHKLFFNLKDTCELQSWTKPHYIYSQRLVGNKLQTAEVLVIQVFRQSRLQCLAKKLFLHFTLENGHFHKLKNLSKGRGNFAILASFLHQYRRWQKSVPPPLICISENLFIIWRWIRIYI